MTNAPGRRIGRYVIIEQVGSGGFGAVFKARQEDLGRTVAVKFLHSEDPEDIKRFVREAQTAAQLSHPNIVPVYDVGEHDGRPFIAMEYIDGRSPDKLGLDPSRAAEIMRDVAGAIHYAHQKGIIHRDLKPQNILVDADGHPWVMDFGLARSVRAGTTMTVTGMMVGTPSYMPPEQAEARRTDERSDVYGLGATLYELVAGRPPFTGQNALDVAMLVIQSDPERPTRVRSAVPLELETIILKAMEKDPARRYSSAQAFAEDLRRHLEGEPILARPSSLVTRAAKWAKRNRATSAAMAVGIAALLVVVAAVVWVWFRAVSELAAIERDAEAAERRGDWSGATTLWARADAKGGATARLRGEQAVRRGKDEEDRRRAEAMAKEAVEREADYERVRRRIVELVPELRQERSMLKDHDPAERKERAWALEAELLEARKRLVVLEAQIVGPYGSALQLAPGSREIADRLVRFEWERFEEALAEGDEVRAAHFEEDLRQLARRLGRDDLRAKLDGGGALSVSAEPAAEMWLFRYEPSRGVLMARPFRAATRESREAASALECTDFNRMEGAPELPRGSYLVLLRARGRLEARLPVVVVPGGGRSERVRLFEEAPAGFVHVPAGRTVTGGDVYATQPVGRETPAVGDFLISRTEVRIAEYVEFLQALVDDGRQVEAQLRSPRLSEEGDYFLRIPREAKRVEVDPGVEQQGPVFGVSCEDGEAYAKWLTEARGGGRWIFRLPSSAEWEKAARGADGRPFPWGATFDWTFAKTGRARGEAPQPERVGSFPRDESPYGAVDLAGSVQEWCRDWFDEAKGWKHIRGGSWAYSTEAPFRAASRWGNAPDQVSSQLGLRVVAVPAR